MIRRSTAGARGRTRWGAGLQVAALALASVSTVAAAKVKAEPYSLQIEAMQDVNGVTDALITVDVDLDLYSAPTMAKHVQVKSLDDDGEAIWTKNTHDDVLTPAADGRSSTLGVQYADAEAHKPLKAQVQVQNDETRKTEVLRSEMLVLLRPDLTVESITPAPQIVAGQVATVHAVVRELNGDLGATSEVMLSVDGEEVDRASDVALVPSSSATVAFATTFDEPGTYTLTVDATDVDPGDYDGSNNSSSIEVEVIPNIQPLSYWLHYNRWEGFYDSSYSYTNSRYSNGYTRSGKYENVQVGVSGEGAAQWPLDVEVSFAVDGADGQALVVTDIESQWGSDNRDCVRHEAASVEVAPHQWVYLSTNDYYGACESNADSQYSYYHASAADYWYSSWNYRSWYGYSSYERDYDYGTFLDFEAGTSLAATMVITGADGASFGGDTGVHTVTSSDRNYHNNYCYSYYCYYYYEDATTWNTYGYGTTTP